MVHKRTHTQDISRTISRPYPLKMTATTLNETYRAIHQGESKVTLEDAVANVSVEKEEPAEAEFPPSFPSKRHSGKLANIMPSSLTKKLTKGVRIKNYLRKRTSDTPFAGPPRDARGASKYLRKRTNDTPVTTSSNNSLGNRSSASVHTRDNHHASGDTANLTLSDRQIEEGNATRSASSESDSMSSNSNSRDDEGLTSTSTNDASTYSSSSDTNKSEEIKEDIFVFLPSKMSASSGLFSLDDSVSSLDVSIYSTDLDNSPCIEAAGLIDTIKERNAIRMSQRRASFSGIQVPWPLEEDPNNDGEEKGRATSSEPTKTTETMGVKDFDHDLIAERKFYKRATM